MEEREIYIDIKLNTVSHYYMFKSLGPKKVFLGPKIYIYFHIYIYEQCIMLTKGVFNFI